MSPRAFAGGAAITVAITGATASYVNGCVWLGTAFVAFGLLALLLTLAKWLPVLHGLPLVGAVPPPDVAFRLEIPEGGMTYVTDSRSKASVVFSAGIAAGRREQIEHVLVNAYVVGSINIYRTYQDGQPYKDGGAQGQGSDGPYWSISDVTIPLGALVMYFKVTIPEPGEYEVVLTLRSPAFYDKGDHDYRDKLTLRTRSQ